MPLPSFVFNQSFCCLPCIKCRHTCIFHMCLDTCIHHVMKAAWTLTAGDSAVTRLSDGEWSSLVSLPIRQSMGMWRERQAVEKGVGWGVWKDGPVQPVVKDRSSLTGADVDTSATALHHLPFSGHANHALWGEPVCSFPLLPAVRHRHSHVKHQHLCLMHGNITDKCPDWMYLEYNYICTADA